MQKNFVEIDHRHIWHPFTQTSQWQSYEPLVIERGEGCELIDVDGNRYLDGVSSLWCNVHGHSVPEIVEAIKGQAEKICHSTLLGLSHRPIIELTRKLLEVLPGNLSRVFYADSGSAAVEAALRIALEYWQKSGGVTGKRKQQLASLVGAYHGDTLGAVGVGFLEPFHSALHGFVQEAIRCRPPQVFRQEGCPEDEVLERAIAELHLTFKNHGDVLAAFIVEPLIQGAAGMWPHPAEYLKEAAVLCQAHDVFLIADEVATGFGKTGTMFAVEGADVAVDMLVMGKGLSAGYLPISAVAVREEIFSGFTGRPEEMKTFYYGQTYAGNPLAARAGVANLEYFKKYNVLESVSEKISYFHTLLAEHLETLPSVAEVRRCGLMVGVELTKVPGTFMAWEAAEEVGHKIVLAARKRGVIIRPLGNVIVLMPALGMSSDDMSRLVRVTAESISEVLG